MPSTRVENTPTDRPLISSARKQGRVTQPIYFFEGTFILIKYFEVFALQSQGVSKQLILDHI